MSNEARYSQSPGQARYHNARGEDPLAELARLIGQGDPFAAGRREPVMAASAAAPVAPSGRLDHVDPRDFFPQTGRVAAPAIDTWQDEPPVQVRHHQARQEPAWDDQASDDRYADPRDDATPYRADQADFGRDDDWQRAEAELARDHRDQYTATPRVAPDEADDPRPLVAAMPPPPPPVYQDEPVAGRARGGLLTVVSVLGLAFLGTAGAFAYRAASGPVEVRNPPVIKADPQPTKIAPTPAAPTTASVADPVVVPPRAERVVPREEQPVSVTEAARAAQPRVVLPGAPAATPGGSVSPPPPVVAAPPPAQPAPRVAAAPPATAPAAEAPRAVRTVPIRPETTATATPQPVRPAPQPVRPAAPASGAPMTLTPGGAAATAPAPAPVSPTQTAALPPAATGGSFVVQVTSQRTEAEAQTAYRSLQQRHSALSSYRPIIRRADLGERGTFFRASAGPFGTREEANQLCANLRAQGGDCVVQRN